MILATTMRAANPVTTALLMMIISPRFAAKYYAPKSASTIHMTLRNLLTSGEKCGAAGEAIVDLPKGRD